MKLNRQEHRHSSLVTGAVSLTARRLAGNGSTLYHYQASLSPHAIIIFYIDWSARGWLRSWRRCGFLCSHRIRVFQTPPSLLLSTIVIAALCLIVVLSVIPFTTSSRLIIGVIVPSLVVA